MDPNYTHEWEPNRQGLCKQIVSGRICHQVESSEVHRRKETNLMGDSWWSEMTQDGIFEYFIAEILRLERRIQSLEDLQEPLE